jgi:hypothetical protein
LLIGSTAQESPGYADPALLDDPSCRLCTYWRRLRAQAVIGRCTSEFSGQGFPHEAGCCAQFQPMAAAAFTRR